MNTYFNELGLPSPETLYLLSCSNISLKVMHDPSLDFYVPINNKSTTFSLNALIHAYHVAPAYFFWWFLLHWCSTCLSQLGGKTHRKLQDTEELPVHFSSCRPLHCTFPITLKEGNFGFFFFIVFQLWIQWKATENHDMFEVMTTMSRFWILSFYYLDA